MGKAISVILCSIALAFLLGVNGGCHERFDVEVIVPSGQRIENAQVLIFNTETGEKVVMPWQEFEKLESLKYLHRD